MGVPSLVLLAQRVAIKYVDSIQSFADAPVNLIAPILQKVGSAEQLRTLERESPQIIGPHTVALWRAFLKRDLPSKYRSVAEPEDPAKWWKFYRKLQREDEARRKEAEAQLRESLGQHKAERESNKATIIHTVIPVKSKGRTTTSHSSFRPIKGQPKLSAVIKGASDLRSQRALARPQHATVHRPTQQTGSIGYVAKAPSNMIHEYSRGTSHTALVTSRPQPAIRKPNVLRSPFHSNRGQAPARDQQAIAMAIRKEKADQLAKEAESKRKKATALAAMQTDGAEPSRAKGEHSRFKSPDHHPPASHTSPPPSKFASKEAGVESSAAASPQKTIKRKAPTTNVFMAQKRARK